MYGYTPSAAMLRFCSAPPREDAEEVEDGVAVEGVFERARSTFGTGTWATKRNTTSIASVKSSFRRTSSWRKASTMACSRRGREAGCDVIV